MTAQQSTTTAFRYIEAAYGGANKRNNVRTLEEFEPNGYADCFRSMLRFPKAFPSYVEYNKGSVTGYDGEAKADFFAADFDHKEDFAKALEDARRTARRWEAVYGVPTEGLHYYFSGNKGIHIEIPEALFGNLDPGRDTAPRLEAAARELLGESETADLSVYNTTRLWRVPGTKHRKSGLYKTPLYPNEFFNLSPDDIRELAKEGRESFVPTDPGEFEAVPELGRIWRNSKDAGRQEEARERVDTESILRGVSEGQRDTELFKLACKLRRADVPQDMAEDLLTSAARNCDPPFPERIALKKVANAYKYPPGSKENVSSSSSPLYENDDDDTSDDIPGLVCFANSPAPEPVEFLLGKVIPRGYVTTLHGAGGFGKSVLAMMLALSVSGYQKECMGLAVLKCGEVLYLDSELDVRGQHPRVKEICKGLDIPVPEGLYYISALGLDTTTAFKRTLKACKKHDITLLVIDSWGPLMHGDMESAKDVIKFYNDHLKPFVDLGVTVLIVDHQARTQEGQNYQKKGAFGSVYKENLARSVIQIERADEDRDDGTLQVRMRHKKSNFGPRMDPFDVEIKFAPGKITAKHMAITEAMKAAEETLPGRDRILAALVKGPATVKELVEDTELSTGYVRNLLSELVPDEVTATEQDGRTNLYSLAEVKEKTSPEPKKEFGVTGKDSSEDEEHKQGSDGDKNLSSSHLLRESGCDDDRSESPRDQTSEMSSVEEDLKARMLSGESVRICVREGKKAPHENLWRWAQEAGRMEYAGRKCGPWPGSKWRNKCTEGTNEHKVRVFREEREAELRPDIGELGGGKAIGCYCRPGENCHVDILLEWLQEHEARPDTEENLSSSSHSLRESGCDDRSEDGNDWRKHPLDCECVDCTSPTTGDYEERFS